MDRIFTSSALHITLILLTICKGTIWKPLIMLILIFFFFPWIFVAWKCVLNNMDMHICYRAIRGYIYIHKQMWLHSVARHSIQCRQHSIGKHRIWTFTRWITILPGTSKLVRSVLGQNGLHIWPKYRSGYLPNRWLQLKPNWMQW
jgi:uncharacterized membrane protein YdbT with pleckstrin-like domain